MKIVKKVHLKIVIFTAVKNRCMLHGRVFENSDRNLSTIMLDVGKTEFILFGSRSRLKSQSNLRISCKGTHIESKEVVKYLGAVSHW